MNKTLQLRVVQSHEIDLMRQLLNVFGEAFEEINTYCHNQPTDEYLQNLLSRDYFMAVAALKSGQVVGGLTAYELHKFEQARSEIYIYDLAVLEEHRRQGIATACIEKLQEIAAKRGAYVVIIQAEKEDEPAVNLYTKLGIREEVLHFDISVPKQSLD